MAELDYGDKQYWWNDLAGAQIDDEGNPIEGTSEAESWFNKYLKPYMKIIKQKMKKVIYKTKMLNRCKMKIQIKMSKQLEE